FLLTERAIVLDLPMKFRGQDITPLLALFHTGYFTKFRHVTLNLSANQLDEAKLKSLAELISEKYIPQNFHLDLAYNQIGYQSLRLFCQTIQSQKDSIPHGLSIDISNHISNLSMERFVANEQNELIDMESAKVLTQTFAFFPPHFTLSFDALS